MCLEKLAESVKLQTSIHFEVKDFQLLRLKQHFAIAIILLQ